MPFPVKGKEGQSPVSIVSVKGGETYVARSTNYGGLRSGYSCVDGVGPEKGQGQDR